MSIFRLLNPYFRIILSKRNKTIMNFFFEFYLKFSSEKQYEPRSTLSSDHLILLIDPRLAHLPLESLDIFRHVQIGGISRDFSIQSVYNRLNPNIGIDENAIPADGKGYI